MLHLLGNSQASALSKSGCCTHARPEGLRRGLPQVEAELDAVSSSFTRLHGRGPELPLDLFGRTLGPPPGSAHPVADPHKRRLSAQRVSKHRRALRPAQLQHRAVSLVLSSRFPRPGCWP